LTGIIPFHEERFWTSQNDRLDKSEKKTISTTTYLYYESVKIRGKKNPYTPEAKNLEEYGIFFYLYLSSAGVIQIRFKGSPNASGLSGHTSPRDFKYISISGKCQETAFVPEIDIDFAGKG
jgi:hypothetical protein